MLRIIRNVGEPDVFHENFMLVEKKKLEHFYSIPKEKRRQSKFEFNLEYLKKLRQALRLQFSAKCAYCESPIPNLNVGIADNFRPKKGARGQKTFDEDHYGWLAYEWKNIYLSCDKCHRFKENWFPVSGRRCPVFSPFEEALKEVNLIVDPCKDNPLDHFIYENTGKIKGISQAGMMTIEILNLNRPDLLRMRRLQIKEFEFVLKRLQKARTTHQIPEEVFEVLVDNSKYPFAGLHRYFLTMLFNKEIDILNLVLHNQSSLFTSATLNWIVSRLKPKSASKVAPIPQRSSSVFRDTDKILIKKIHVSNFKAIRDLTIEIPEITTGGTDVTQSQEQEPWLMLLGENGVGKSSILQAIALCLMGQHEINLLPIKAKNILNYHARKGFVKLYHHGDTEPIQISFSTASPRIKSNLVKPMATLLGYGSTRLSQKNSMGQFSFGRRVNIKNIFNPGSALVNAHDWIVDLKKRSVKREKEKKLFDWLAVAMKALLLAEKSNLVVEKGIVKLRKSKKKADNLDDLSDGYKSIVTLTVDIIRSLLKHNSTVETAQGIVLIDEIGTHLHPRWKMEVVKRMRNVFPKLQFIVTTHDPLCLRGLRKGEVTVFTRSGTGKIFALTDLPDPSKLNAEQLLSSPFFGLSSTYSPDDEEKFNEYYFLLGKPKPTAIELARIEELRTFVRGKRHVGRSTYDMLINDVIDEEIGRSKYREPKSLEEMQAAVKTTIDKKLK